MGYITDFTFTLVDCKENKEQKQEDYKSLLAEIDELEVLDEDVAIFESSSGKWYGYDADMTELTMEYPNITVQVNGRGEEFDDMWVDFWRNGKCVRRTLPKYSQEIEDELR